MKILIVGSGGREHALAWKVASSPLAEHVYCAPGNAGTALERNVSNIDIGANDLDALLRFAKAEQIDLTIVGPEQPLVEGIADAFQQAGQKIFAPTRAAARLEGSKIFAKEKMLAAGLPTAAASTFTELVPAIEHLRDATYPLVIKADGLAAGKGVVVARDFAEAERAANSMLAENKFGAAGKQILIEKFLAGEELSVLGFVAADRVNFFNRRGITNS